MSNGIKRSVSQLSSSLTPPPPEPLLMPSTGTSPVASTTFQRKRAKRELKEKMPIVFPPKNTSSQIRIGCHVSAAGGVQNSCENAAKLGARSFALFLKNQRQWSSAPLPEETVLTLFPESLMVHGFDASRDILPHGSYLVNLANPEEAKRDKSYECFLDDIRRCEQLGIGMFNFHPGSAMKQDRPIAIGYVADAINRAHASTSRVTLVLENMAGQGDVLGSRFEDLRDIIALVTDKSRVGICIDTCHLFAASITNDIRTPETLHETLSTLFALVPIRYLRALHINDSLFPLGSKHDRHANIGLGEIGLEGFWSLVRWRGPDGPEGEGWSWRDVVWCLETPSGGNEDVWRREIELLHDLEGIEDPNLLPPIKAAWEEECKLLKAAAAGPVSTKSKEARASKPKGKGMAFTKEGAKRKKTGEGIEEEKEAVTEEEKVAVMAVKVKSKAKVRGKKAAGGGRKKKIDSDEDRGDEPDGA